MTEYYTYTGSNKASVTDEKEVERVLSEYEVIPSPRIEEGKIEVWADGAYFDVPHPKKDGEKEFLQELAEYLEEPLIIEAVGFNPEGGRPNHVQWVVADGKVRSRYPVSTNGAENFVNE